MKVYWIPRPSYLRQYTLPYRPRTDWYKEALERLFKDLEKLSEEDS